MNIPNWRLNLLIGLNSFILFLLIFEYFVRIPPWVQVVGRMHSMLLHFPIVLLLLTAVLINFSRKIEKTLPLSQLVPVSLFATALAAAVTVIMGLLLAQEGGYEGDSFLWHKWTGVGVSVFSLVLVGMQRLQYTGYRFLLVGVTNLCVVLVLVAGHYGASLTHGEGFVLAPLQRNYTDAFDIQTAAVFDDAVLPILRAKCISCHAAGKSKGELSLSDSAALARGGESGLLFVAGDPEESLLIQRLLLDIDHEHRMPPKGKPQLTPEELALLHIWVARGAKFGVRVASLPPDDSLMLAIGAVYQIVEEEKFDFPAPNARKVAAFSTPYRVIRPLAAGSPALSVNFYGVSFYTDQALADLEPLAEQVVSLDVSHMPLGINGLGTVSKFVNLRTINLNNTPVDDEGISSLGGLPKLRDVSLNGTAVTAAGVERLLANPAVRQVFIWNTSVSDAEASRLAALFPAKNINIGFVDDGQNVLPLTAPEITPSASFFRDRLEVTLHHPIPGVEIRYSLNGQEPDSLHGTVFDKPLVISSNQKLRVKAFKAGWEPSPLVERTYTQSPKKPDRVVMEEPPHYLYPGQREHGFFDLESGGSSRGAHADGKWQGYYESPMSVALHFDEPTKVDTIAISVMQNYYGINQMQVYMPEYIEVWGGTDSTAARLLAKMSPTPDRPENMHARPLVQYPVSTTDLRYLKLIAQPYRQIPEGYPGAGGKAWMFVDEIVLK